ncbi:MAG: hypothetical protein CMO54_05495 [Verrucomicrobiales bacterium]|nr:hypothetical protein [Verrucomicrobiales bacterium]
MKVRSFIWFDIFDIVIYPMIAFRTLKKSISFIFAMIVLLLPETVLAIVINEIHHNPPDNTVRQEFIEIFNPDEDEVNLGGWRLSGAVNYVFSEEVTIGSGEYLVIAEDPETLRETLNVSALGPYEGSLDSEGETLRLRNLEDEVVDLVDYRTGFPWPVASSGGGASMELLNPNLDNSLGSSWRASAPQVSLNEATIFSYKSNSWDWRPGDAEASNPITAWRYGNFSTDGSWSLGVKSPIGYGRVNGVTLNTSLDEMRGNYSSIYLRNEFSINAGEIPSLINLYYVADDGFILWINGKEVERLNYEGVANFDATASGSGDEGKEYVKVIKNPGSFLIEGRNTIAVQLFNSSLSNSDLGFDLEIVRPKLEEAIYLPSPGAKNTAYSQNAPPNIRKVSNEPEAPTSSESVVIAAKVTDPDGVSSVTLEYCVIKPGSFVPAKIPHPVPNIPVNNEQEDNPDYEKGWVSVPMVKNGNQGEVGSQEDVYSALIPPNENRSLIRYRIIIEDSNGIRTRAPFTDDPSLNFAYFIYDGIPNYNGQPGSALGDLPVYHLITRELDYNDCLAYNGGKQISQGSQARFYYNWQGAMVYDGVVYDNIKYRLRGANGRYYNRGKRSMRFRFNKGSYFQARDQNGKKHSNKWRTLTTGKGFDNRGTLTYGLNEAVSMYLFNKVGVPATKTHWVQWRVIDNKDEAPDNWRGDFHGINFVLETYDVRFMESHNLEKGNLYKLINQTSSWSQQQRYQAPFAPKNGRDHSTIENQLDGRDSADFIRAHVNIEKWNSWHALAEAIRHYDFWPSANKNMVYYFEPDYLPANNYNGKLWILPWDTDASWGPTWNSGHDVVYNSLFSAGGGGADANSTPELWPDYFNKVREIRDLLWQEDQIGPLIDAFAAQLKPLESADAARWKGAPSDAGSYSGIGGAGASSIEALVRDMKNFAFSGGSWPGGNVGNGGRGAHLDSLQRAYGEGGKVPRKPIITFTGNEGFKSNNLTFESSTFSDPQGNSTFGSMQWRLAEITPVNDEGDQLIPIFSLGSDWKYLDDGSNQGAEWRSVDYDDANWSVGSAPLGYADNQVVTTIDYGGETSNKHLTTYFRKKISIENLNEIGTILIGLQRDDGAVIYVNGNEVGRSQMPDGEIFFDTRASGSRQEDTIFEFKLSGEIFNEGENIIAVEVHQASPSSSDMIFDFSMSALGPVNNNPDAIKLEWDADWDTGPIDFEESIQIPSSIVRSGTTYRARVRHSDNTGRWSNWSDPIEFEPETPDLSEYKKSLVVTEIMYHPGFPSSDEIAAGYTNDFLFEYIEVKNIGEINLDLRNLRFTKGVDFDFFGSKKEFIGPGEYVIIVNNIKAFEMRYGEGLPVAGQWQTGDKLSNGGERIKLSYGGGDPIIEFEYDDDKSWPLDADGSGPSLVLVSSERVPKYSDPQDWKVSASASGSPGEDESGKVYSQWKEEVFGAGEIIGSNYDDDPDSDGIVNVFEYALGSDPLDEKSIPDFRVKLIENKEGEFLCLEYQKIDNLSDVTLRIESSQDLQNWESSSDFTRMINYQNSEDGYLRVTETSTFPLVEKVQQNIRLSIQLVR